MSDNFIPKISIITINRNNLKGLILTINSVRENKNEFVEYVIIDGGSSDGSKEYIEQNSSVIDYWISETDKGIYDAMNKGIMAASGNYILFLNSGDFLIDNNLSIFLRDGFQLYRNFDLIYFNIITSGHGEKNFIKFSPKIDILSFFKSGYLPHCATLIRRNLFFNNLYSLKYKIASDWHFFADQLFVKNVKYKHVDILLTQFDLFGISANPSNAQTIYNELVAIKNEVISSMPILKMYFFKCYFFLLKFKYLLF